MIPVHDIHSDEHDDDIKYTAGCTAEIEGDELGKYAVFFLCSLYAEDNVFVCEECKGDCKEP